MNNSKSIKSLNHTQTLATCAANQLASFKASNPSTAANSGESSSTAIFATVSRKYKDIQTETNKCQNTLTLKVRN